MKLKKSIAVLCTAVMLMSSTTSLNVNAAEDKGPYANEVFQDVGSESGVGERTRNTGYNLKCRSSRYDNVQYDAIPVIDCSVERIGLDYANYSYYGGRHYSYEAFDTLKQNGCEYVLLYLGQSPWDSNKIFNSKNVRDFADVLVTAVNNAHKANVKIGLIWEGNAVNQIYAFNEATYVYNTIKDHSLSFDLPLFYAPEYSSSAETWEDRTSAVKAFFTRMKYLGYEGNLGLYTNGYTNQGACIDANKIHEFVPDICIWVPAYDHCNRKNPNFDDILYMHQYTGDYGLVPDRGQTLINGVGYQLDISMAFPERPDSISNVYTNGRSISWDAVNDCTGYKLRVIHSNYTYDEIITNDTNYVASNDTIKVYVKAIKTDKFNFTADSYSWAETPNEWSDFDFSTMDLDEYYKNDDGNTNRYINNTSANSTRYKVVSNSLGVCHDYIQEVVDRISKAMS